MRIAIRVKALVAFLAMVFLILAGCGRTQFGDSEGEKEEGAQKNQANSFALAQELLLNAPELPQCHEGVRLINDWLNKTPNERGKISQSGEAPKLVQELLGLTDEEVDYLKEPNFTTLDEHYLAWCSRLKAAADTFRAQEFPALTRAETGFSWVMRHVVLDDSTPENIPSPYVLRQGYGTANQRALIFLSLLRQMDLVGCMLTVPDKDGQERLWIPGVFIETDEEKSVYLFDTRLSMPLPGPKGKGIATLSHLMGEPEVFEQYSVETFSYDVTHEQAKKAKIYLVCPFSALSPRMSFLEQKLQERGHIRLGCHPLRLKQKFADDYGLTVQFWTEADHLGSEKISPMRGLRDFLPPSKGGKGNEDLFNKYMVQLVRWADVVQNYRELEIFEEIPAQAQQGLVKLTANLFEVYYIQPRHKLLRGELERITTSLGRIDRVLEKAKEGFEQLKRTNPAQLEKELGQWRNDVESAYAALNNQEPGAEQAVNRIWGRDRYLTELIVSRDEEPNLDPEDRTILSFLVLSATEEPLREKTAHLLALCWLEKALIRQQEKERLQSEGKEIPYYLRTDLKNVTITARDWLKRYSEKNTLSTGVENPRLTRFKQELQRRPFKVDIWDKCFLSLRYGANMELQRVDGLYKLDLPTSAKTQLDRLVVDLQNLLENPQLKGCLRDIREVGEDLPAHLATEFENQVQDFENCFQPGGGLYWYAHAATLRQKLLE